ncbi:triosephosphate isomerase [Pseudohongiella nitratireducens]|jgi:triosephosphate isomerase|uniref:Triosephosphate isomerase n=1 Tax=Pseudohongiella nitratireducens TaxID=1768907 RepID=A0A916QIP7_9GAMM|nr:triose-phosphate isomerase [Pseudohongiella nitratireducens]MDF1624633.1 triose-phosphate isomerase [Pseudohongiella nitratireducens]GFZ75897.1 triosephosphate isomerase [Pseudohongiella nitratireducens]|tara:strand:+ start:2163 stop:2918 length:756 start_codon:yes stop_codon:yes gene_type:complete
MRRALVAGNWKMNGSQASIKSLVSDLLPVLANGINGVDVVVCPPYPYLGQVAEAAFGSEIVLGAQDLSEEASGAFTGEVSGSMLSDFRVRFVLVGHSERRVRCGESDELVAKKFAAAQAAGLIPVLCVGESLDHRQSGHAEDVVATQMTAIIEQCGVKALEDAVIAYEPVWAIGTGQAASAEDAQLMHAFIRQVVAQFDAGVASGVQILYGGSVNADNAEALFACEDIDGGLVGGASLNAKDFIRICQSVS